MNKIAIVYKSKYGSTKQYAMILQEALQADVIESKEAKLFQLQQYDTLVFAGGVFASGIGGISVLRQHYAKLAQKNIFVLAVGSSQPRESVYEQIKTHSLKDDLNKVPMYYARGQWDVKSLNFVERQMCKMMKKSLDKKEESEMSEYDREFLELYYEKNNWVSKEQVETLIQDIKAKSNS